MLSGMNSSRRWGDWMVEEDETKSQRFLRMPEAQWKECARKAIAENRGRGDLRPVLNWLDSMEDKRAAFQTKTAAPLIVRDTSPAAVTFRIWKEMILEPAKYGDADWDEWLEMNSHLMDSPGRWRVGAFWAELDAEEEARLRAFYATRIQAAWRGHRVRDTQEGLNCEDCLARTFAPQDWNGKRLCVGCLEHRFEHFGAAFVQPVVPSLEMRPEPEVDEHGNVACNGCGRMVCPVGDYGEYRPGWWCSRQCAYD